MRCTLQDEPYNTFERFYILDISGQFYKPLTNWSTHLTNSDLVQQRYGLLVNGECDISIPGLTESSLVICQCNQGNKWVMKTICSKDNLHIITNDSTSNGACSFLTCIRF